MNTVPMTDSEVAAAYRALSLPRRWRVRWQARLGRTAESVDEAGVVAWRARRNLRRQPWEAGLQALGVAVAYTWLLLSGFQAWFGLVALLLFLPGTEVFLHRPRLRRAAVENARWVAQATGKPQPQPAGRTRPLVGAVVLSFLLAIPGGMAVDHVLQEQVSVQQPSAP